MNKEIFGTYIDEDGNYYELRVQPEPSKKGDPTVCAKYCAFKIDGGSQCRKAPSCTPWTTNKKPRELYGQSLVWVLIGSYL